MIGRAAPVVVIAMVWAAPVFGQSPEIELAKKVFTAQKCSLCHSIAGQGKKEGPLDDVGTKLSAAEIREWIVNAKQMTVKTGAKRKPVMKDFAKLPKAEVDALVAYLQTLKK
jgi:mono/diheme cytochrome c family protein